MKTIAATLTAVTNVTATDFWQTCAFLTLQNVVLKKRECSIESIRPVVLKRTFKRTVWTSSHHWKLHYAFLFTLILTNTKITETNLRFIII